MPPTVEQLLEVNQKEFDLIESMDIESSDVIKEKGSVFIGYAVRTKSIGNVRRAFQRI